MTAKTPQNACSRCMLKARQKPAKVPLQIHAQCMLEVRNMSAQETCSKHAVQLIYIIETLEPRSFSVKVPLKLYGVDVYEFVFLLRSCSNSAKTSLQRNSSSAQTALIPCSKSANILLKFLLNPRKTELVSSLGNRSVKLFERSIKRALEFTSHVYYFYAVMHIKYIYILRFFCNIQLPCVGLPLHENISR